MQKATTEMMALVGQIKYIQAWFLTIFVNFFSHSVEWDCQFLLQNTAVSWPSSGNGIDFWSRIFFPPDIYVFGHERLFLHDGVEECLSC